MKQALLDTDTISYYFRNQQSVVDHLSDYLSNFGFIDISVVTYYEIMNGLFYKDARNQMVTFEQLVSLNEVIPLTQKSAQRAAEIFSDLRKRELLLATMM